MTPPNANQIELFFGDANPTEARIYAQLRGEQPDERFALGGKIHGPFCEYARTLPAEVSLSTQPRGDDGMLASAVLPDPCFWTPHAPYCYRVQVQIRQDTQVVAEQERLLGIRAMGTRGRDLMLAGKRWVLRGAFREAARSGDVAAWHEAGAALWQRLPDDDLCEEASRLGVLIVAGLADVAEGSLAAELQRLARWPAVAFAALPSCCDEERIAGARPRNLLLAEVVEPCAHESPVVPKPWADALICRDKPENVARRTANCGLPVLAYDPRAEDKAIQDARSACDALQRDLAPVGEFAGYIV